MDCRANLDREGAVPDVAPIDIPASQRKIPLLDVPARIQDQLVDGRPSHGGAVVDYVSKWLGFR